MAYFIGGTAGAVIGGALVSTVGGALLADDYGAEGANDAAAANTRLQSQIAKEQWDKYQEIYDPLERQMVKEAQQYDTPEQYARAAGDASATVSQQFSKARERLGRTPGLDPSSGAYQASLTGLDLAQAATDATQQNVARQKVKDTAYARKTDALSLGKGLPANAASTLSSANGTNLSLAQAGMAQANNQANAIGALTNRVINAGTNSNWLGSGSNLGYALGTTNVSPAAVSAANATSDPLGSLITSQGW